MLVSSSVCSAARHLSYEGRESFSNDATHVEGLIEVEKRLSEIGSE